MGTRNFITIVLISVSVLVFDLVVDNYLLFHIIAEFFAVSILITLFVITWNAREFLHNGYLIFIGIGGLFIGVLDLLHTITYKGMNIIPSDIYYANQFWIATRLFESLMILLGFIFVSGKKNIHRGLLLGIYSIIALAITLSILVFENFPLCYVENVGQTPFKIYSEYVVIALLFASLFVLVKKGDHFEKEIRDLIFGSIVFAIISEFCFTLYVQNYDFVNKLGHVFKIISFYLLFKANIQSGFKKPMETFFRDLKISDAKIKATNRELEKQIATQSRFFSILAHDLRAPFTVLLGYSEYLVENINKLDDTKRTAMMKNIYDTSDSTLKLLENLLSWSAAQSKTLTFNPVAFNIRELLEECYNLIIQQAKYKSIDIIKEYADTQVTADKNMILTVVRNLLSNAVKFTPRNGHITIKTYPLNSNLKIAISDTGVGMPREKIESLFQVDKNQSTRGTENEKGIGLGLIISYEFIRLHNGELIIESEVNKGSTFSFELPVA